MSKSPEQKDRDRKWRVNLYPDDPSHKQALSLLDAEGYKYVGILHDKDVVDADDVAEGKYTEDQIGTPKKAHYHLVLKFPNPVYYKALAKKLGITENYIRECANFDEACKYLVHATKKSVDKYQYDSSELFGSLVGQVKKLLADEDEGARVLEIVKTIDSTPGRASYRDILIWACKNGLYGEFRRLGTGVKFLLDEHNELADIERIKERVKDDEIQ